MQALHIHDDATAVEGIKDASRPKYVKAWKTFKDFVDVNDELERRMPSEEELLSYFRHVRTEKGNIESCFQLIH
jgi:hypothetical protein